MAYSTPSYASHKRTVRCSYCGARGHNRAGCAEHKERIETLRADHGDDHYTVRCHDQKKARKARAAKIRKCSFCDEVGHNRATCPSLKGHMAKTKADNIAFRTALNERFKAIGFGVGAIVTDGRHTERVNPNAPYVDAGKTYCVPQVVTRINWEHLNSWNNTYGNFNENDCPFLMKPITKLGLSDTFRGGWLMDKGLIALVLGENSANQWMSEEPNYRSKDVHYYFSQVQSPVPPTEPPSTWLDGGEAAIKAAYKGRAEWQGVL